MEEEQEHEQDQERVTVRPARPEDRGAVLGFSVDTFEWGDYIAEGWDKWLTDPNGQLLVGELGGLPVAVEHVAFPTANESWLQGLRVDPAVRRRGIGRAMLEAALVVARERGANVARLFTAATNEPVHRMMAAHDFHLVAKFAFLTARASPELGTTPEAAVQGDLDDLWRIVQESESFRLTEGTYCLGWVCLGLTRARLAEHVSAGEALVLREEGRPAAFALAVPRPEEDDLWLAGLYGESDALGRLTRRLRARAARLAAAQVAAMVPEGTELRNVLVAAGFASAHGGGAPQVYLYAKDLSGP